MSEGVRNEMPGDLPPEVWSGLDFTNIHAAMLFADLESSVLLSSTIHSVDYQRLINEFQTSMINLVWQFEEQGMFVSEYHVAGDQLSIFFYDPKEVWRIWRLDGPGAAQGRERESIIDECRKNNQEVVFNGLRAAILLKNAWLAQNANLQRVRSKREALGLGIGLHAGRVHLCNRADGQRRVEGYAVNYAKRVETFARNGKYSKIMLSQEAHDIIRGTIRKHTMLRQRIFFHTHETSIELLKGILQAQRVCELKFFSRIGISSPPEVIEQYEQLYVLDKNNIWAYYQLFEYYAYVAPDWDKVYKLARQAYLTHPRDEKVMLDLSRYYFHCGSLDQAVRFAEQALAVNPEFDLAYEHLAVLAHDRGDTATQLECFSKALSLTPGSPINHLNLGFALCESGQLDDGGLHILEALRVYPGYLKDYPVTLQNLAELKESGKLPKAVAEHLAQAGISLAANASSAGESA